MVQEASGPRDMEEVGGFEVIMMKLVLCHAQIDKSAPTDMIAMYDEGKGWRVCTSAQESVA